MISNEHPDTSHAKVASHPHHLRLDAPLDTDAVREVYRRRARHYDVTSRIYDLVGYRLDAYRDAGVNALELRAGDTVVELGCGTGANLSSLVRAVGPRGRVIGVDLTDAMLAEARARIAREGWSNVELVQSDMDAYRFPEGVGGVISTYALTLCPEYDAVLRRAAEALRPGGRLVVVDFKAPDGWPQWLLRAIVPLVRPFAVTLGLMERHPWESVARYCEATTVRELYLGMTYIAAGSAPAKRPQPPAEKDQ